MSQKKVKIKKLHENAVIPAQAYEGDAGIDLTAVSFERDRTGSLMYGTGLAIQVPEGHVGLLFPRSSIYKKRVSLSNSVGVLDSGYQGEVKFIFKPGTAGLGRYEIGDRIGQLVIVELPKYELEEVEDFGVGTERGQGGFGSSNG